MFYSTLSQFGLTFDQVRKMFPQLSLRSNGEIQSEELNSYQPAPTPDYDPTTHAVREIMPIDGMQQWEVYPLPPDQVEENLRTNALAARERAKAARQAAVDAIKVTIPSRGWTFDGDEASQTRMSRAIVGMLSMQTESTGPITIEWVLADNTVVEVTASELTEALTMAGLEQSRLWVIE